MRAANFEVFETDQHHELQRNNYIFIKPTNSRLDKQRHRLSNPGVLSVHDHIRANGIEHSERLRKIGLSVEMIRAKKN